MRFFAFSLALALVPGTAFAQNWLDNYAEALKQARVSDKPVLLVFTTQATPSQISMRYADLGLTTTPFVTVLADKSTPAGQELFRLFEIQSDAATVVVEREQVWQYARVERSVSDQELTLLLNRSANAKGKPIIDVLAQSNPVSQSFYFPADTKTPAQSTAMPNQSSTMPTTMNSWMQPTMWNMPTSTWGGCPNCRR